VFHCLRRVYVEDTERRPRELLAKRAPVLVFEPSSGRVLEEAPSFEAFLDRRGGRWERLLLEWDESGTKRVLFVDRFSRLRVQAALWKAVLEETSSENLAWLHETANKDERLKANPLGFSFNHARGPSRPARLDRGEAAEAAASVPPIEVPCRPDAIGFEYLLASFLGERRGPYRDAFLRKIELFSWEQILQEFGVIRAQVINGLYNDINLLLPEGHKIDPSEDVEYQIPNNRYLSWLLDENLDYDNIDYVRCNYDLSIFATLYDNWIRYRAPVGRTPEEEVSLDNLSWITDAIQRGEWELLFDKNLQRNFGCVYVDNAMLPKANQVWTGLLYREHNEGGDRVRRRLQLKARLVATHAQERA